MTLFELSEKLNKSPSTLMTNFRRTQENLKKKGIIIIKEGEGKNANYTIIEEENENA